MPAPVAAVGITKSPLFFLGLVEEGNPDSCIGYIRTHHSPGWYYSSSITAHQAQRLTSSTYWVGGECYTCWEGNLFPTDYNFFFFSPQEDAFISDLNFFYVLQGKPHNVSRCKKYKERDAKEWWLCLATMFSNFVTSTFNVPYEKMIQVVK